jgi:hypothetical protein
MCRNIESNTVSVQKPTVLVISILIHPFIHFFLGHLVKEIHAAIFGNVRLAKRQQPRDVE